MYSYKRYKLLKRIFRLNVRANVFSNRVIDVWNDLPDNIVNAPSVNTFKNGLNNYWHGHPYKFEPACYHSGHSTREYSRNRQDAPFIYVFETIQLGMASRIVNS